VTELLRANLYEFQRYIRNAGEPEYFTLPRVQSIAGQVPADRAFHASLTAGAVVATFIGQFLRLFDVPSFTT